MCCPLSHDRKKIWSIRQFGTLPSLSQRLKLLHNEFGIILTKIGKMEGDTYSHMATWFVGNRIIIDVPLIKPWLEKVLSLFRITLKLSNFEAKTQ